MDLCLSLIKDNLPYPSELFHGREHLEITRFAFLDKEILFAAGLVYLAKAEELPSKFDFEQGAALICVGTPPESYILSKLPLLVLPPQCNLFVLANELGELFQAYRTLEESLTEALRLHAGIQELIDIMTPYVSNELLVVDSNHLIQGHSFSDLHLLTLSGIPMERGSTILPVEVMGFFANNRRWVEAKSFTKPFIYNEGIFNNRLLCINIMADTTFACRVMMSETERPFNPYDVSLLTFFTAYVKKAYERILFDKEQHEINNLAATLRMILSGADVEPWKIKSELSIVAPHKEPSFTCLHIKPGYWDDSQKTVSYYCRHINKHFPGTITFEFHGDIVCFATLNHYENSLEVFLAHLTPFLRDNNFRVGVSEVFKNITYFKNHCRQAEIALSSGTEGNPSWWIHRFQNQAVDYLMKQAGKEIGVHTFCAEKILMLNEYDTKNNSSYVSTVECFFKHHLNAVQTAQEMNIHRATMVYRLKRIKELSGIDFHNAEENLYLQLSIKLLKLIRD